MYIENRHTCLYFKGEHTNWRIIASSALKMNDEKNDDRNSNSIANNVNVNCWFRISVGTDREPFLSSSSWE